MVESLGAAGRAEAPADLAAAWLGAAGLDQDTAHTLAEGLLRRHPGIMDALGSGADKRAVARPEPRA
jgi:hypothetical protein